MCASLQVPGPAWLVIEKEGAGPTGRRPFKLAEGRVGNHLLVQDAKLYAVRDHATHHAIRPSAGKQLLILPLWCHGWQSHAHWQLQRGDLPEASLAKELLDALADVLGVVQERVPYSQEW